MMPILNLFSGRLCRVLASAAISLVKAWFQLAVLSMMNSTLGRSVATVLPALVYKSRSVAGDSIGKLDTPSASAPLSNMFFMVILCFTNTCYRAQAGTLCHTDPG